MPGTSLDGVRVAVAAAIGWWLRALWESVPAPAARLLLPPPARLCIEVGSSPLVLHEWDGARRWKLPSLPADADQLAIVRAVRSAGRGRRIRLELGQDCLVRRRLSLPRAIEAGLASHLRLEMDRLVPFAAEDARYGWRIVGRDASRALIGIELVAAHRRTVDAAIAVARGWGFATDRLEVGPADDLGIDLLRPGPRLDLAPLGKANLILVATLLSLLVAGGVKTMVEHRREAQMLAERVATARQEAETTQALRRRLEALTAERAVLHDLKIERPTTVAILAGLADILPDDAWLESLAMAEGAIELRGFAAKVEDVVEGLVASPLFDGPTFRSPLTRERDRQRFHIAARLETAGRP